MSITKKTITVILSLLSLSFVQAQVQNDPVLNAIKNEVDRNKVGLHVGNLNHPFWISYRLMNASRTVIVAAGGNLVSKETRQNNIGSADLLMGDYAFNNNNYQFNKPIGSMRVGETNLEAAVKIAIWTQLDPLYKKTAEAFERKKVQIIQQNIPKEELEIHDFDQSSPVQYYQKQELQEIDLDALGEYCRKASKALCENQAIISSDFRMEILQGDLYYYSTDGFTYRLPLRYVEMIGNVECRSEEGQKLSERYSYYFDDLKDITPIEELCQQMQLFNGYLIEESKAPEISEAYSGPILYEGDALTNAIEAQFLNKENGLLAKRREIPETRNSGYSENRMEQMIGKKVADRRLNFISMTGRSQWNGQKLFGHTPIDAQGVRPDTALTLVENGILKNLLSDRTPTKTNPKSNGHNLFDADSPEANLSAGVLQVKASQTIPQNAMKDSLLMAAKDEGYHYAYIYRGYEHMSGCFLYKIGQDGREKMVRNFSINDFSQKQFKYILHIGREEVLHNTLNGNTKISLILPCSIIFKDLEIVRRSNVSLSKPYLVPRPEIKSGK